MGNDSGRRWWTSALAWGRAATRDPDFADHGTAFGLDASLAGSHEPSSRHTGIPAASDFAPPDDLPPETAKFTR